MGQGIGTADDFLEICLYCLRFIEPACFQAVGCAVLVRRDVDDVFLQVFRFRRGFRHDCLFLNGRGRILLLRGFFCAARRADDKDSGQSDHK